MWVCVCGVDLYKYRQKVVGRLERGDQEILLFFYKYQQVNINIFPAIIILKHQQNHHHNHHNHEYDQHPYPKIRIRHLRGSFTRSQRTGRQGELEP